MSAGSCFWGEESILVMYFSSICGEPGRSKKGLLLSPEEQNLLSRGPVPGLVPTSTMVQSGCVSTWPSALESHVSGLHRLRGWKLQQAGRLQT